MKSELDTICREVPFNSFGKILLANGEEYPEQLGGNCVYQNRRLTNLLIRNGLETPLKYTTASQRPHWVVLSDDGKPGGDTYLLDPYLLHKDPINVSQVLREGPKTYDAYPTNGDRSSAVEVRPTGEHTFDVQLFAYRSAESQSAKPAHTYSYDLRDTHDKLPPDNYQLLAGLCQKNLELGVLRPNGGVTRTYLHPEDGHMGMMKVGEVRLNNRKHVDQFEQEFGALAEDLQMTPELLRQTFNRGLTAYLDRQAAVESSQAATGA